MAEITDTTRLELRMHAFRLMRSGNYFSKDPLLAEMRRVFPDVPMELIRRAVGTMAAEYMGRLDEGDAA